MWNLIRWVSPRTIKETFTPPHDYRYPFMDGRRANRTRNVQATAVAVRRRCGRSRPRRACPGAASSPARRRSSPAPASGRRPCRASSSRRPTAPDSISGVFAVSSTATCGIGATVCPGCGPRIVDLDRAARDREPGAADRGGRRVALARADDDCPAARPRRAPCPGPGGGGRRGGRGRRGLLRGAAAAGEQRQSRDDEARQACLTRVPSGAAGRRSSAPSSRAARARPRAPPRVASTTRLRRAEVLISARRRAGPTPSSWSNIDSRAAASRRWRWNVIAKRCASSRMRCRSCSPGEVGGRRIGSVRPGTNTSSIRFASAITATRGRSSSCMAASAADSWPLPPSITTRFGVAANDSFHSAEPGSAREPREAPRDHLAHRREVVLAVEAAHRELAVVAALRDARPRTRPSSRRSPGPGCWRCRSTRSGSAATRG